jgi:hypothetical protein
MAKKAFSLEEAPCGSTGFFTFWLFHVTAVDACVNVFRLRDKNLYPHEQTP